MVALPPEMLVLGASQLGALSGGQLRVVMRSDQITRALAAGRLVRLFRDSYALPGHADLLATRLRATDLTVGAAVPVLHTAAALHGFDLSGDPRLHLLAPKTRQTSRPELVLHRQRVYRPLVRLSGRDVLNPVETAVTVACVTRSAPHQLAVLDAAVRAGCGVGELSELADSLRVNGVVRVRQLAGWADGAAESPGESWLRWVILDADLPPPVLQHWLPIGPERYARLDLAWPDRRVACEYDGVAFHTGAQLFDDRVRMNALTRLGWTVIHVTSAMVFSGRRQLVAQLAHHLR